MVPLSLDLVTGSTISDKEIYNITCGQSYLIHVKVMDSNPYSFSLNVLNGPNQIATFQNSGNATAGKILLIPLTMPAVCYLSPVMPVRLYWSNGAQSNTYFYIMADYTNVTGPIYKTGWYYFTFDNDTSYRITIVSNATSGRMPFVTVYTFNNTQPWQQFTWSPEASFYGNDQSFTVSCTAYAGCGPKGL